MAMPPPDAPLTTADCALYMGRSVDYVHKVIRLGHLRATRIGLPGERGRWAITPEDFRAFLEMVGWHRLPKVG